MEHSAEESGHSFIDPSKIYRIINMSFSIVCKPPTLICILKSYSEVPLRRDIFIELIEVIFQFENICYSFFDVLPKFKSETNIL